MGLLNGLMGNMSQVTDEELNNQFGTYLLDSEEIKSGYKLVRDMIAFTNIRIIFMDRQNVTGKKAAFKSIYFMSIIDVEAETAGFGIDDSEIVITYLANVHRTSFNEEQRQVKFEFPKSFDFSPLYKFLGNIAYKNRLEINGLK
ncbi:PH domain-containing protein [Pediococcus acidilactici]|uniref:PH domain-containing protein n=1 Tax=Pediococcus acidilactici TaxID=1254 RepID=UPI001F4EF911|nr:PH domain-containing protein [Pediococcus acidilactici]MCH9267562.1 PH domain-containing protein [Pediococcus acidilactici]MCK2074566.1 PH domain-containing protein [Pediococcus acidilactici]